jgi:hypothetical protein
VSCDQVLFAHTFLMSRTSVKIFLLVCQCLLPLYGLEFIDNIYCIAVVDRKVDGGNCTSHIRSVILLTLKVGATLYMFMSVIEVLRTIY